MATLDTYRSRPGFGEPRRQQRPNPPSPARTANRQSTARERGARNIAADRAAAGAVVLPQRIGGVCVCVGLAYLGLAAQLAHIQIGQHHKFVAEAKAMRRKTIRLDAPRGVLLDRNGTLLVQNEPAATIVVDPNLWGANLKKGETFEGRKADAISKLQALLPGVAVASIIDERMSKTVVNAHGKIHYRTVDLARRVPVSVGEAVRKANPPGVGVLPDSVRKAINGDLAPQIVGFTGQEGAGLDGLEKTLDPALDGKSGFITAEFDKSRVPIPGTEWKKQDAEPGRDTVLTLDASLQQAAESALEKVYRSSQAEAATVVILDPKNGDILAMANRPTYNVNHRDGAPVAARLNRAVSAPYEPGSTLKVITMAAALEEKVVTPDSHFYCGGSMGVGNRTIHCAHGEVHHDENSVDVIKHSCNVATAQIAFKLGKERLYEYEKRFGFGGKTGAGLPGESRGMLTSHENWSDIQLANVAFGQGISVTPLQIAAAYAAIANNGKYCQPRIIWGKRDSEDQTLKEDPIQNARQIISPETARSMRYMLQEVVDHGTGTKAQLNQWTTGGKTGTAQVAEHGHYSGKYVASFIGMAPMNDPQFVVLVAVSAPKGSYFGGEVAAPVFKEVMEKALLSHRVAPDKQMVVTDTKQHSGADKVSVKD